MPPVWSCLQNTWLFSDTSLRGLQSTPFRVRSPRSSSAESLHAYMNGFKQAQALHPRQQLPWRIRSFSRSAWPSPRRSILRTPMSPLHFPRHVTNKVGGRHLGVLTSGAVVPLNGNINRVSINSLLFSDWFFYSDPCNYDLADLPWLVGRLCLVFTIS